MFSLFVASLYASSIYNIKDSKIFGFLASRGTEDTRTLVELYFYDDMKENDWIFGKGIAGKYFCPDIEENQETNYRYLIETGYLQMILKGGLINLILLLLILIPAVLLGFFNSKNILSKAAAIWILLFLFKSYPTIATTFDVSYALVWFSVGICYSKQLRNMTDSDICLELNEGNRKFDAKDESVLRKDQDKFHLER